MFRVIIIGNLLHFEHIWGRVPRDLVTPIHSYCLMQSYNSGTITCHGKGKIHEVTSDHPNITVFEVGTGRYSDSRYSDKMLLKRRN